MVELPSKTREPFWSLKSLTAFMTLPHRSSTASLPTKGRALIGRLKARRTPESITMRLPITTIYCSKEYRLGF